MCNQLSWKIYYSNMVLISFHIIIHSLAMSFMLATIWRNLNDDYELSKLIGWSEVVAELSLVVI